MKIKKIIFAVVSTVTVALIVLNLFTGIISRPNLIYLETYNSSQKIYKVDGIENLTLDKPGNPTISLNNIKYCRNLKKLTVDCSVYSDIDFSVLSKNLNELNLYNYKWKNNFDNLLGLEKIMIARADYIDAGCFKNLQNLQIIDIEANKIENISELNKLNSLEKVSLYASEIELSKLEKIKNLFISSSYIENSDLIIEMKNLESVTIWHDKSGELSLDAFCQLPNLKKLSLFDCNIKENAETQEYISILENKLEEFDIS